MEGPVRNHASFIQMHLNELALKNQITSSLVIVFAFRNMFPEFLKQEILTVVIQPL
jgi:hypothetical protein